MEMLLDLRRARAGVQGATQWLCLRGRGCQRDQCKCLSHRKAPSCVGPARVSARRGATAVPTRSSQPSREQQGQRGRLRLGVPGHPSPGSPARGAQVPGDYSPNLEQGESRLPLAPSPSRMGTVGWGQEARPWGTDPGRRSCGTPGRMTATPRQLRPASRSGIDPERLRAAWPFALGWQATRRAMWKGAVKWVSLGSRVHFGNEAVARLPLEFDKA